MKRYIFLKTALVAGITVCFAFQAKNEPWVVPDKYAKMSNPVASSPKSIKDGQKLFVANCQTCHGAKGKGDGPKAPDLKKPAADLTKADVQDQSDGALFYKISEGRGEMPKAKKDLPDDQDRWSIVDYLRTFKK
ncbi:MAG: cytochrome c [Chitinophagaceae bacterium]|jgi:mono/diheme cytochrome c family protein|nr:cytochrome c [Chitinophagaceae bacterium]